MQIPIDSLRDRECVCPSFIIPGLNDQGSFSTWPGKSRVVVVEKFAACGHIFCWTERGRERVRVGGSWKLLRHLPVVRGRAGSAWGRKVKSVNDLQNFPLKALLILSSQSLVGERGKSPSGSVDLIKVKAKWPFDLYRNVNSNLLLVRAWKCHQTKHNQSFILFIFFGVAGSQVFRHV